jgi:hypothetical protein
MHGPFHRHADHRSAKQCWSNPKASNPDAGGQARRLVLAHKMREAMASEMRGVNVGGEGRKAEIDGGNFGGYVKPANRVENRKRAHGTSFMLGSRCTGSITKRLTVSATASTATMPNRFLAACAAPRSGTIITSRVRISSVSRKRLRGERIIGKTRTASRSIAL